MTLSPDSSSMPYENIEERTLRVLLDQLPALVWTTDADLRVTATAGEFARFEELTPVGTTIYERWGPDDPVGAIASHERALSGESVEHEGERSEERRVGKECRSRWSPYH